MGSKNLNQRIGQYHDLENGLVAPSYNGCDTVDTVTVSGLFISIGELPGLVIPVTCSCISLHINLLKAKYYNTIGKSKRTKVG